MMGFVASRSINSNTYMRLLRTINRITGTALISFFLLLYACASGPGTTGEVLSDPPPVIPENPLKESRRDIGIGSPESLIKAYNSLTAPENLESDNARELAFVAYNLLSILYPLYLPEVPEILPPTGSIFISLFEEIQEGGIPHVKQGDISFITLFLPAVGVFFSEEEDILLAGDEILGNAVLLNPDSVISPFLLGIISEKLDYLEEAQGYYENALQLSETCYPAHLGLARLLISSKNWEGAMKQIEDLLPFSSRCPEIARIAAFAEFGRSSIDRAADFAAEVLQNNPDDLEMLFLRVRILEERGNLEQAERLLSVVEGRGALNEEGYLMKARLRIEAEDYQSAMKVLEEGRIRFPEENRFISAIGELLIITGDWEAGKKLLFENLEGTGQGSESLRILLDNALLENRWEEVLEYSEKLLEAEESAEVLHAAYTAAFQLERDDAALRYAEKLYKDYGDKYIVSYLWILVRTGDSQIHALVEEAFGLELAGRGKSELYVIKSILIRDIAQKIELLQSALLEDLENTEALILLSRLYRDGGDFRRAYRYLKQAAALRPEDQKLQEELESAREKIR
ncbi:MAG: hypothetical protein KAU17_03645 [Spirochaetales bacterium]|nr:hypothetical protein [Spirochaetales bacterium]